MTLPPYRPTPLPGHPDPGGLALGEMLANERAAPPAEPRPHQHPRAKDVIHDILP